jgi:hypothetical protein
VLKVRAASVQQAARSVLPALSVWAQGQASVPAQALAQPASAASPVSVAAAMAWEVAAVA